MDAQNYVGSRSVLQQLLRDADVSVREFEDGCRRAAVFREKCLLHLYTGKVEAVIAAARLAEFFEAIAQGNRAKTDEVLRRWRIRG